MLIAGKGVNRIEQIPVDRRSTEHQRETFRASSPVAKVPVLEFVRGLMKFVPQRQ